MFALRFCAHFIEKNLKLSPIGLLLICAMLACFGLNLVSGIQAFGGAMGALAVYALGKTFFWPTMLAVVGDRFPRTGAVAISIIGGIGMMSAGLIGSPGLGYAKDRFASEELQKADPAVFAEYKGAEPKGWLIFDKVTAIDGKKLGEVKSTDVTKRTAEQQKVLASDMMGDRRTLKAGFPDSSHHGPDLPGPAAVFQIDWRLQTSPHRDARKAAKAACDGGLTFHLTSPKRRLARAAFLLYFSAVDQS